jgi:FAD/FMN-containing dehydrogenase
MTIAEELKNQIQGEICVDEVTLKTYSRDASIFQVTPQVVIYPTSKEEIQAVVKSVLSRKRNGEQIALAGRSAGTDMTGGSLTEGVVLSMTRHLNRVLELTESYAIAEPGVFYRDFEKETLSKDWIMPSYPASRELCAIGGIVMNNSGGEKTLKFGKTENYVEEVEMVLSNGDLATFKKLTKEELDVKKQEQTFEGEIYRKMYDLITTNYDLLEKAKPHVSKNSAGYYLWNVYNKEQETFDLSKVLVGSQGTLGILTKAKITGIKPSKYSRLLVVFLKDISRIGEMTNTLLAHKPETVESYDDQTLKVAVKFFFDIVKRLNGNIFKLAFEFLPEFFMVLGGGMPKLIVMAEFTGDTLEEVEIRMKEAHKDMLQYGVDMRMTKSDEETQKYWTLRRESFNLLRQRMHGHRTAPFIDDIVVNPEDLPSFLPRLQALLAKYPLTYTIAGHVGNGNFHIIPLMDLAEDESISIIKTLSQEAYSLVKEYKGSITGEHNDGLIRTTFLPAMYDESVIHLFEQTKDIFDPEHILNPGKKVRGSWEYAVEHIDRSHEVLEKQTYMPC